MKVGERLICPLKSSVVKTEAEQGLLFRSLCVLRRQVMAVAKQNYHAHGFEIEIPNVGYLQET